MYSYADNRCPKCNHGFRTLEDEFGQHACPRCGYYPEQYGGKCDECDLPGPKEELIKVELDDGFMDVCEGCHDVYYKGMEVEA